MRNGNWGYSADYSKGNWTGRVPRQSRITGEWAVNRQRRIPLGDVLAVVLLGAVIVGMMFI